MPKINPFRQWYCKSFYNFFNLQNLHFSIALPYFSAKMCKIAIHNWQESRFKACPKSTNSTFHCMYTDNGKCTNLPNLFQEINWLTLFSKKFDNCSEKKCKIFRGAIVNPPKTYLPYYSFQRNTIFRFRM